MQPLPRHDHAQAATAHRHASSRRRLTLPAHGRGLPGLTNPKTCGRGRAALPQQHGRVSAGASLLSRRRWTAGVPAQQHG